MTVRGGHPAPKSPPERESYVPPGNRALLAVIVMTGLVLLFAAGIAFWMYWLQGSLPT